MPDSTNTTPLQDAVAEAITRMQEKLATGDFKMTIAEFARLLELQRELSADSIRHVKVTWVNPFETEPVTAE